MTCLRFMFLLCKTFQACVSCYDKVGRLIYLRADAGQNPPRRRGSNSRPFTTITWATPNSSHSTRRCALSAFSASPISEIKRRALAGENDEAVLAWAHAHGTPRTDEECHVWNRFIAKLGWRDERSHVLPQRIQESGLTDKPVETLIDHIEF